MDNHDWELTQIIVTILLGGGLGFYFNRRLAATKNQLDLTISNKTLETQKKIHEESLAFQENQEKNKSAKHFIELIALLERKRKLAETPALEYWRETLDLITETQAAGRVLRLEVNNEKVIEYLDAYEECLTSWYHHIREIDIPHTSGTTAHRSNRKIVYSMGIPTAGETISSVIRQDRLGLEINQNISPEKTKLWAHPDD